MVDDFLGFLAKIVQIHSVSSVSPYFTRPGYNGKAMRVFPALIFPFRLYWAALTDVSAYPGTLKLSRLSRTGCLLLLYAFFSLAATANFGWRTLPRWQSDWRQSWEDIQRNWPEDLSVEYRGGQLKVDPEQVFVLPYPAPLTARPGLPANFARIDARPEPDNPGDSLLFVGRDRLTAESTVPLSEILGTESWELDKAALPRLDGRVNELMAMTGRSLIVLHFFIGWIGWLLVRLLGLAFYAWIAQALFYFAGTRLRYGKTYALGMVALLPAETVQILIGILYPGQSLPLFWWTWLAVMGLVAWVNRKPTKI
jgi:hypothetical protein